ncbi:MAG: DoxX family protein [Bacteroidetes bacterium]|nr:DoxX family protein [Bacteroidota bacterium]
MKNLATFGRILFGLPFGIIGLNHFLMKDVFLGMMSSFVPGGGFTIMLTGVILILASISIIINKYVVITCYSLASLLLLFIITIHIPGLFDPKQFELALIELLKDTGLMGGALMIAAYYRTQNAKSE